MTEIISFNDALDAAIKKEEDAVEFYLTAMNIVKFLGAKDMLHSFVEEEKRHVILLTEAKESKEMSAVGKTNLPPDLSITKFLVDEKITEQSTPQDVMVAAMKNEANAVSLYAQQAKAFKGSELEAVFHSLMNMEKEHKEYLETEYEKHFMPDN
jgi:rubrerythrin